MGNPKKRLTDLERQERALADRVDRFAQLLDAPAKARDPDVLEREWRAIAVAYRALREMIKDILRDTTEQQDHTLNNRRATRELVAAARATRTHILHWHRVNLVIEQQVRPGTTPLLAHSKESDDPPDVMDFVCDLFIDALHKVANPAETTQSDDAYDSGMYRDIPLPMAKFSGLLSAAYRLCLARRKRHELRFLDVGSGGGTKVLAAMTCFPVCHGLEYEHHTVKTGSKLLDLLNATRCKLMQGDAFTFSDYASYDAIYFYRPVRSTENMIAMENCIFAQARPGTVLMVPGGLQTPDFETKGVQHITGRIYVTGMSKPEAEALHDAACDIGTSVRGSRLQTSAQPSMWEPLLEASRRNGYRHQIA